MLIAHFQFGDFFDIFQKFIVIWVIIFIIIIVFIVLIIYFVLKFFFGTPKKERLESSDRPNPYRKRKMNRPQMKFCEQCGEKIEESSLNCPYCGARTN